MDYFLIYLDEYGEVRAAVPDAEGVYKHSIEFPEYEEDLTSIEVVILKTGDLQAALKDGDDDDEFVGTVVGKYVASAKIHKCIKEFGFEKFFTTIIKKHIEDADDEE